MDEQTRKIADLNDAFRKALTGHVYKTQGVSALPAQDQKEIFNKIRLYHDFNEAVDPMGEHDFGAVEHKGEKVYWKIDCYDKDLQYGSEDPADPGQTTRVMTIMLASEY